MYVINTSFFLNTMVGQIRKDSGVSRGGTVYLKDSNLLVKQNHMDHLIYVTRSAKTGHIRTSLNLQ